MNTISTQELGAIFRDFLAQLPNPNDYPQPSIVELLFINGEGMTLRASKTRGMEGLIWNVEVVGYPTT